MTTRRCAFLFEGLLILFLGSHVYSEVDDFYSNSFISPNSAKNAHNIELKSKLENTNHPTDSKSLSKTREERSASPILSKSFSHYDNIMLHNNIHENIDSNDFHSSNTADEINIRPSKTVRDGNKDNAGETKSWELSGEGFGAPQARQLSEPLKPTATESENFATPSTKHPETPRQANPDIQDIITGIVKLLNGNVNVQANTAPTMGRPVRPLSTRINNRGPPRITDVQALPPDFDVPSPPLPPPPPLNQKPPPTPSSTRLPTPYPFDMPPPPNTSLIRPNNFSTKRPNLYRPVTIPPWNRSPPPYRRPFPPRRPPNIPQYKPNPEKTIVTSDKPHEDILTLDLGSDMVPSFEKDAENSSPITTTTMDDHQITAADEDIEFERNKEKSSLKMDKHSSTVKAEVDASDLVSPTMSQSSIDDNVYQTAAPNLSSNEAMEQTSNQTNTILDSVSSSMDDSVSLVSDTEELSNTPTKSLPDIVNATPTPSVNTVESSTLLNSSTNENASQGFPYYPYKPRPGIVLDDPEYKPLGAKRPPVITARPAIGQIGEIFDVTVSAIQGPGSTGQGKPYVIPVDIQDVHNGVAHHDDVITSPVGNEGFVSIDGKRTYLNLFGEPTSNVAPITPTSVSSGSAIKATGYVDIEKTPVESTSGSKLPYRRPTYNKRPTHQPPVRIDTCIVGDDTTCDASQFEICMTEAGVSSCHCRPGHARRKHREPCRRVVSLLISLRVDRLYDRRLTWSHELANKDGEVFKQLSYEAERALDSAMSMTPFSDEFLGAKTNSVYEGDRSQGQAGVFVNLTLQIEESAETSRNNIKGDIQRHLLGVIQRRSNNIGNSALWVDSPPGSVSNLQDIDECSSPELNDCHALAQCINTFGGFKCVCGSRYRDPWSDNKHRAGRHCEQCSSQYCNNRGECKYENGQEACKCSGNYYGAQCELDGEVLGVAIGASVAAVIIIGLTLVCLVMWSRKWNREQKAHMGSPVFGYMATAGSTVKTPVVGGPPYQLTLEDRMRWAQIADAMAQTNHYAPEPVNATTRPSSAMFGYPTLSMAGTLPHISAHGTLPPIPLPRLSIPASLANRAGSTQGMRPLDNSSSSEEEDKTDLLGRNFQVPRPKSRSNASIANQSGIYYDVDYDQNEIYKHPSGNIPMSTYTSGRHPFYRN